MRQMGSRNREGAQLAPRSLALAAAFREFTLARLRDKRSQDSATL